MVATVEWLPYLLNPSTPPEGVNLQQYLGSKYGSAAVARFSAPGNPLDVAGSKVGIRFNKNRLFCNSLNAHRLMENTKANYSELADALMEALFHAYFEEGLNIHDVEVLVRIAISVGLPEESTRAYLNSPHGKAEVLKMDQQAKSLRVSGVPYFIIESDNSDIQPIAFSGAQVLVNASISMCALLMLDSLWRSLKLHLKRRQICNIYCIAPCRKSCDAQE